ncbi:signal peptidase I [Snuella lapsa]|uniref:Signal peptidase I n=1 Tax=Snuella lapsa TaxID=870481 RepID=A0ABP6X3T5_9FLAO
MLKKVRGLNIKLNNYEALVFTFVFGLFIVLKLYWLLCYSLMFWSIFYVFARIFKPIRNSGSIKQLRRIALIFFLFVVAISTKLLVGDIYKIPSSSMNNTLYTGDVILVNKLKYGPRLPRSPFEIPWVNIAFCFNDNAKKHLKENWWNYKRLSGYASIKQGDVFVFNLGLSKDFFVVKRCVGLSGDTISIKNGRIYTNGELFETPDNVKNTYQFKVKDRKQLYKGMDSLGIDAYINADYGKDFNARVTLSKKEVAQLKELSSINSFQQQIDTFDINKGCLHKSVSDQWTYDNMGPLVIPKKGMTIQLIPETVLLYGETIKLYEKRSIEQKEGGIYVNGEKTEAYTFKQDYYFMMGDNRKGTIDSRSWGFLPESNIVGKVQCVLWSNYRDEFQWSRLFKKVE